MPKLKDDPQVQDLITKAEAKVRTTLGANMKKAMKELKRDLKTLFTEHATDAKTAGNPDAKARITAISGDAVGMVDKLLEAVA